VTLRETGKRQALPAGVDVSVYRIVQEALTNVLRHADATHATVELQYLAGSVQVAVADDGRAQPTPNAVATGQGLAGMRERAELFEGTFAAGPRPGGGFAVTVTLPTDARGA
jgi:signal transduction histidine kinase